MWRPHSLFYQLSSTLWTIYWLSLISLVYVFIYPLHLVTRTRTKTATNMTSLDFCLVCRNTVLVTRTRIANNVPTIPLQFVAADHRLFLPPPYTLLNWQLHPTSVTNHTYLSSIWLTSWSFSRHDTHSSLGILVIISSRPWILANSVSYAHGLPCFLTHLGVLTVVFHNCTVPNAYSSTHLVVLPHFPYTYPCQLMMLVPLHVLHRNINKAIS